MHAFWDTPHEYIKVIANCNKSHPFTRNPKDVEAVAKACVLTAMYEMRAKCSGMHGGHVTCVTYPATSKKVVANKAFKVGDLQLQCFATTLVMHTGERAKNTDYAEVEINGAKGVAACSCRYASAC